MNTKRFIYRILVSLVLVSCNTRPEEEQPSSSNHVVFSKALLAEKGITQVPITAETFYTEHWATGQIGVPPEDQMIITSPFEGTLTGFNWMPGQEIKKGVTIGYISSKELLSLQADYKGLRAELTKAEAQYQRDQQLFDEKVISRKQWEETSSNLLQAQSALDGFIAVASLIQISKSQLASDLPLTRVALKAPFTGQISEVVAANGTYFQANEPLFTLTAKGHKHVEFDVFESVVNQLKASMELEVFQMEDTLKDHGKLAEIHLIGTAVESESRSIPVHADFIDESEHENWLFGQYAKVKLKFDPLTYPSLPEKALVKIEGNWFGLKVVKSTEESVTLEKVQFSVLDQTTESHRALPDSYTNDASMYLSGDLFAVIW